MGRKKSKKVVLKKAGKERLETTFSCPFCHHESAVDCKLDRQRQIGTTNCRICSAGYQTVINYLSEPVDVYGEWIDAIDAQEQKKKESRERSPPPPYGNEPEAHEPEEEQEEFTDEDLVDYREMPERNKTKGSSKSSKLSSKRSRHVSSSDESQDSEDALFGSSSESEASFTDND